MKTYRIKQGEWIEPTLIHSLGCCDCGLVHRVQFKVVNGRVQFRVWRDKRATAATRRWKKKA